ncbi:MAG: hypothetical protein ACREDF_11735, partial [Thermoplasmata archaeon]
GSCTGSTELVVRSVTAGGHVNDDPTNRPQFSLIDSYTAGVSDRNPMFVLVADSDDLHSGCSAPTAGRFSSPPQPTYSVGLLTAPTALAGAGIFGRIDLSDPSSRELSTEDPQDPAPSAPGPSIAALRRAGVLDDVLFFIDNSDPLHPSLARGLRRGSRFDVVALAEDVEDLQVAYGVDGLYGSDSVRPDGTLGRLVPVSPEDPDPEVSTRPDGDEWVPNAEGERLFVAGEFQSSQPPPLGFPHTGALSDAHCPALRAVMISLVAKSRDPDPGYRGRGAYGLRTMNSPSEARAYPSSPAGAGYRRRVQTLRVTLRNYGSAW